MKRLKSEVSGRFDPFSDRLARDIRNTLSEAFVAALTRKQRSVYQKTAATWLNKNLAQPYVRYIHDRLQRYGHIFKQINDNQLNDVRLQTLLIWNKGLFFEVHDHLETIWARTSGDEHQALKGLIKASGVFIHMEHGHQDAVERLSLKSSKLLRQYSHCLTFITNLNVLIETLAQQNPKPPRLENPAISAG